jgi:DnaJ-class molecular chaperone
MGYQEREYHPCQSCGGMGWHRQPCPTCYGAKKVQGEWCPTCQGVGELHTQCSECHGQGVVRRM